MNSSGKRASGRTFQSRASSSWTWTGVPMDGESTHSDTRRSVSHTAFRTPAPATAAGATSG